MTSSLLWQRAKRIAVEASRSGRNCAIATCGRHQSRQSPQPLNSQHRPSAEIHSRPTNFWSALSTTFHHLFAFLLLLQVPCFSAFLCISTLYPRKRSTAAYFAPIIHRHHAHSLLAPSTTSQPLEARPTPAASDRRSRRISKLICARGRTYSVKLAL